MDRAAMRRNQAIRRLRDEVFDLLVIGGGITGAGTALDAAARGLRTALVEKDDFASGTSSKSSKLIHGGLRYLAHLEVGLVREALTERAVLQQMAPYLVQPIPFVIPKYGKRRLLGIRVGLDAYNLLAFGSGFPRHRKIEASDVVRLAPSLKDSVDWGLLYWDARTDDTRLVWTVVRSAVERGAAAANYAEVMRLLRSGPAITGRGPTGRVTGAEVFDHETGERFEVRARAVVNATGVWSDEIQKLEDPEHPLQIRPSKGIHIVLDSERVRVNAALLVPAPDGRYVFVIPWQDGRVVVGTTDEDYHGDIDTPRARRREIDYLLDVLNRVLAEPVSQDDVVASFAGLRPLIQKPGSATKDLSRRHKVTRGDGGLVTITGGKLTTWRPMAADAVDTALEAGAFRDRPSSPTADIRLAGGDEPSGLGEAIAARVTALGIGREHAQRLYERYGALSHEVLDLADADRELAAPLHPDLTALRAEAAYAIDEEMAMLPGDVLSRRLRIRMLTRDRGLAALDWVCDRLASAHGWSTERRDREAEAYRARVEADLEAEKT